MFHVPKRIIAVNDVIASINQVSVYDVVSLAREVFQIEKTTLTLIGEYKSKDFANFF